MGNTTEFVRVADILIDTLDFDRDINVSVFETNIRGIYLYSSCEPLSMPSYAKYLSLACYVSWDEMQKL